MFDLIKKTLLTGIGLALITKAEVEDLAKDMAKRGRMSEREGKKFISELNKRYEESRNKLEKQIEKAVKKVLKQTDIVTNVELKGLKKEIIDLKKALREQTGKS